MPKKNITYLLGAGASYHSIPVVEGLNSALDRFFNYCKKQTNKSISDNSILKDVHRNSFDQYEKVLGEALKHKTVDTYARKLHLQKRNDDLLLLKELLCLYFAYEQSSMIIPDSNPYHQHRTVLDSRYDVFFATLLNEQFELPENIKILSWNYDNQLELAYAGFDNTTKRFNEVSKRLKIYPQSEDNVPQIVKLNGSAFGMYDESGDAESPFRPIAYDKTKLFEGALEYMFTNADIKTKGTSKPTLTFAWEHKPFAKKGIEIAKKIFSETEELIVIGYSFPNFNRAVDAYIFQNCDATVRVQCMPDDYDSINQNIQDISSLISKSRIDYHNDIDQFYIPTHQLID